MEPQPSRLHIAECDRDLALDGVIDSHTADQLDEAFERCGVDGDVAVDLSAVSFVDSSGLRSVLAAHRRLLDAGHELRLGGLQESVRRLLAITNLDAHLCLVDEVENPSVS